MTSTHDPQAICRTPVLLRVQHLTGIGIEPVDFAVVAGHEPQVAARWLAAAYRIAAVDDLSRGFDDALELVRAT